MAAQEVCSMTRNKTSGYQVRAQDILFPQWPHDQSWTVQLLSPSSKQGKVKMTVKINSFFRKLPSQHLWLVKERCEQEVWKRGLKNRGSLRGLVLRQPLFGAPTLPAKWKQWQKAVHLSPPPTHLSLHYQSNSRSHWGRPSEGLLPRILQSYN